MADTMALLPLACSAVVLLLLLAPGLAALPSAGASVEPAHATVGPAHATVGPDHATVGPDHATVRPAHAAGRGVTGAGPGTWVSENDAVPGTPGLRGKTAPGEAGGRGASPLLTPDVAGRVQGCQAGAGAARPCQAGMSETGSRSAGANESAPAGQAGTGEAAPEEGAMLSKTKKHAHFVEVTGQAGTQEVVPGQAGTQEAAPEQPVSLEAAAEEGEEEGAMLSKTKKHAHLEQLQAWDGEGSPVSLVPPFHPKALQYCTAQALPSATLLLLPTLFSETNHTYDNVTIDVSCQSEACGVEYLVDGLVHVALGTGGTVVSGNSTVLVHLWDANQHFKNTTYSLTVAVGDPHGHSPTIPGLWEDLLVGGEVLGCALVAVLASLGVRRGWFATGVAVVHDWAGRFSGDRGVGIVGSSGPYEPLMGEPQGQGRA